MNYFKKNKILIWIIIILLATNIATITTIIYHSYTDDYNTYKPEKIRIPDYKLGRFIRDELDLTKEQHEQFRSFRKDFHVEASKIAKQLKTKRSEMLNDLSVENSDTIRLHEIADEIGLLHRELKHLTFEYYLNLKNICNEQQRADLYKVFKTMHNSKWELKCRKDSSKQGSLGKRKFRK